MVVNFTLGFLLFPGVDNDDDRHDFNGASTGDDTEAINDSSSSSDDDNEVDDMEVSQEVFVSIDGNSFTLSFNAAGIVSSAEASEEEESCDWSRPPPTTTSANRSMHFIAWSSFL